MKKQLILIDLLAPKGHISLIKRIISIFKGKYEVIVISSESFCLETIHYNTISIDDRLFKHKNRYNFVINQILIINQITKILNSRYPEGKIMITSFENISFAIAWKYKKKTTAILHNNLEKQGISKFFFQWISKNIIFLAYEKYIVDFIAERYNRMSFIFPHTINITPKNAFNLCKGYVFAPSAGTSIEKELSVLIPFIVKFNLQLFAKSNQKYDNNSKIIMQSYFENYEKTIMEANYIYISCNYNNRISGVFYDAMCLNKPILINKNSGHFLKEMKNKYPNSVFIIDEFSSNISPIDKDKDFNKFILNNSNDSIFDSFEKAL